jgi:Gas vesicle protein
MSDLQPTQSATPATSAPTATAPPAPRSGDLGDILERVLDKGIVIAGDIQVNLLDIELLTIRLRLIVASVDTAREIGINWWETDPRLRAGGDDQARDNRKLEERIEQLERRLEPGADGDERGLEAENRRLRKRLERLERQLETGEEGDG